MKGGPRRTDFADSLRSLAGRHGDASVTHAIETVRPSLQVVFDRMQAYPA